MLQIILDKTKGDAAVLIFQVNLWKINIQEAQSSLPVTGSFIAFLWQPFNVLLARGQSEYVQKTSSRVCRTIFG